MASHMAPARSKASCYRCHKRKKRCDRALPSCNNCQEAHVRCSFLDDDCQIASYPVDYVRNLERRIRDMEKKLTAEPQMTPVPTETQGPFATYSDPSMDGVSILDHDESSTLLAVPEISMASSPSDFVQQPHLNSVHQQAAPSFVGELKTLSLEATAERHLGSTSGVSFARLTQMVLRRLNPDRADFVFVNDREDYSGSRLFDFSSPSDLLDPSLFESLNESISLHPVLFGDIVLADTAEPNHAVVDLSLTDESHINHLVEFYFAHSNTLYPILHREELLQSLQQVRESSTDETSHPPLCLFRIWMVLAIGSTAFSSISLSEESESMVYYSKALEYLEQATAYGDMATLEVIMLQVSFSFFNQLGPNTWFLVGLAARLALGMGLHSSSTYIGMPVDLEQRRKRIFFSIYMMDRVVSLALGRPFALHEDDIDTTPFAGVDDEYIKVDGIQPQNSLQPSLMAVPLHILALRRIAGKIAKQVYSNRQKATLSLKEREELLHALHRELIDWRRNMPFPLPDINDRVPHLTTTWFDFNYYTHTAMLYRPSPLLPTMDPARVKMLLEASSMSLRLASNMHRQRRFAYNWLNLLTLFTSTLSLIYSTTVQPSNLVTILKETKTIDDLDLAIEMFNTLGVKFPAANKIRGMIEEISRRYRDMRDSAP